MLMQKGIKFWKQYGVQEIFLNLKQIEIISWKVWKMSFIALKNKTKQNKKYVSAFWSTQQVDKNCTSTFHGMMSSFYAYEVFCWLSNGDWKLTTLKIRRSFD